MKLLSSPNQKIVHIEERTKRDSDNIYATTNIQALQAAMNNLNNSSFKLWCYLNKNQEHYQFELSQKACAEWGIKKDSYYSAVKDLINKGYLICKNENSNIYSFYEMPFSEKQKDLYFNDELQFSENPKNNSEKQKAVSES